MRTALRLAGTGVLVSVAVACSDSTSPAPRPPDAPAAARRPAPSSGDHQVAVFYVVPRDVPLERIILDRVIDATLEVQAWYRCATGGVTWELAFPEAVRVYVGDRTREEYVASGYYSTILAEMQGKGLPILDPGTVAILWARGAGFFAGANPACDGECGVAMVGVEAFPEFNVPEWSGRSCPPGEGVAAFPCLPVGAFAHELGHALASLPHPFDVPATREVAFHSVMQTHWNYPDFASGPEDPWGFLTVERTALRASPFLTTDVGSTRSLDCDVVNLPVTGAVPRARFALKLRGRTVQLANKSKGAELFYWTFGDGAAGSTTGKGRLVHTYDAPGTYTVTLRASSAQGMIDLARRAITVSGPRAALATAAVR